MPVFYHRTLCVDTHHMEARYGGHFFNAAGTLNRDGELVPLPRDAFRKLDFARIAGAELFEAGNFLVLDTPHGDHVFMLRRV